MRGRGLDGGERSVERFLRGGVGAGADHCLNSLLLFRGELYGHDEAFGAFMVPDHSRFNLFSAFLQDEVRLRQDLSLTGGIKIEHNAFTGFEFEPSAQLVWAPTARQTVWASAARAIRQTSLLDENLHIAATVVPLGGTDFGVVEISGNPQLQAENVADFEVGYRNQVNRKVSIDVSGFASHYSDLRIAETGAPFFTFSPPPPHLVFPTEWQNQGRATNFGAELSGNWDVTGRWRISPGFSFLHMNVRPISVNRDSTQPTADYSPSHQAQLRSSVKLTRHLDWDTSVYFVGVLKNGPVPAYTRVDTHLGWTMRENVDLSVSGQNLLAPRHFEFVNGYQVMPTEVERSVVGKATWRF
jgi:iron complex outermembrane receptor protein